MTLYLYFGKRFLRLFLRVFAVLSLLIFVVGTLENIRSLAKHGVGFGQAAVLAVYSSPEVVLQAMPIIVMVAGLAFSVGLARSNEFIVTRAIGVSALRAMMVPALLSFALGVGAMFFLNPLAAFFSVHNDNLRGIYTNSERRAVSFGQDGFWLRQKDIDGHTVIHAKSTNSRGTSLRAATALKFNQDGQLVTRLYSGIAILRVGEWVFTNGKFWQTERNFGNPEITSEVFEIRRFRTEITPEQILDGYPKPQSVPIWDKWRTIQAIGEAGFSTLPHRIHLNIELSRPLMLVAMMIIGAAFTLKSARFRNLGISVGFALICGFTLYFIQSLAMTLGEAGEIPVFAAAWAPPLAAALLAVGLFLRFEDG